MELQLGLGLPGGSGNDCEPSMINQLGFDLNNCFDDHHHDHQHQVFAGSCSFDSTTNHLLIMNVDEIKLNSSKKRSFDEAGFDHHLPENSPDTDDHIIPQTLPLLVWHSINNDLSDQDDNDHDVLDTSTTCSSSMINKCRNNIEELGEEEVDHDQSGSTHVIGWPPLKPSRKKQCRRGHHHHKHGACHEYSKSMFVKVKMEGVGIARKVDLTLHSSFLTLTTTLMSMFGKCQEDVKSYNLTYQHKAGGWLPAGDVPWGSFIETVQRLKLVKKGC